MDYDPPCDCKECQAKLILAKQAPAILGFADTPGWSEMPPNWACLIVPWGEHYIYKMIETSGKWIVSCQLKDNGALGILGIFDSESDCRSAVRRDAVKREGPIIEGNAEPIIREWHERVGGLVSYGRFYEKKMNWMGTR